MIIPQYSPFFATLHDEKHPVGNLGRGTHYSILRCAEWRSVTRKQLEEAQVHDFAVIWDEDHDTRIIPIVEQMYMKGLLSPVQFIGERKAILSVIVAAKFLYSGSERDFEDYKAQVAEIASDVEGDSWNVEFGHFDKSWPSHQTDVSMMIASPDEKAEIFLRNIDNLWDLGTKKYQPPVLRCQDTSMPTPLLE